MNKWLACLLLVTGSLMAQENDVIVSPKLSVEKYNKLALFYEESSDRYQKTDMSDVSAYFSSVESEFMRLGFNVIDRAHVNKVMEEHQFSQSGAVSSNDAIEAGKILGVKAIVILKYFGSHGLVRSAQIRMIDVETSAVLISASFVGVAANVRQNIFQRMSASNQSPSSVTKLFFEQIKAQIKK